MKLRKEEIARKLLHLFALIMPVCIFYFPRFSISTIYSAGILAVFFAGSIVIETLRFRNPVIQKLFYKCFGMMLREDEAVKTTGSTFIIGAALLCAILFHGKQYISFMVLTVFILGDAMAAIVGLSVGKIKIGKKSLEGSAACFVTCLVLFFCVFPFVPGLFDRWQGKISIPIVFAVALSTTLFELIPLRIGKKFTINDNLAVPVISGLVVVGLERILGM